MKRPGNKTTRLIAWTLSGSILTASCTNGEPFIIEEVNSAQSQINEKAHAIHVALTNERSSYLKHLSGLSEKIVKDRGFAKEFVSNPKFYMRQIIKGSEDGDQINKFDSIEDAALLKVVHALADDEIASAINDNDIKRYLLLMHEKGFLDEVASVNDYSNLLTVEEKKELLESIGLRDISSDDLELMAVAAVVLVFYAAVVAVSWVGVAYTVASVVNAAALAAVVAYAGTMVKTKVNTSGTSERVELSSNFNVYMLTASDENKEILFNDENINKAVQDVVEAYSEIFVSDAKKLDLKKLEQTIILNLSKQEVISNSRIILEKNNETSI